MCSAAVGVSTLRRLAPPSHRRADLHCFGTSVHSLDQCLADAESSTLLADLVLAGPVSSLIPLRGADGSTPLRQLRRAGLDPFHDTRPSRLRSVRRCALDHRCRLCEQASALAGSPAPRARSDTFAVARGRLSSAKVSRARAPLSAPARWRSKFGARTALALVSAIRRNRPATVSTAQRATACLAP